jgi:hypothetical protein
LGQGNKVFEWLRYHKGFLIILLCLVAYGVYQTHGNAGHPGMLVTAEEWGESWAFKVDKGYIYNINQAAIFETDNGRKYQLNGVATTRGYALIDPIWLDHPNAFFEGEKVDIGPFIALALKTTK